MQDLNEGNPFKNFSYIFSTGNYIDSLQFSGNVQLAETGKADSTLLVFLYKDLDDSAVLKHKPRYTSRVDTSGNFIFHNLPGGIYNVYALKDESGQKVYNHDDELFAFADSTIKVDDSTSPVKLFAYQQEKPKPKTSSTVTSASEKKLKYATSLVNGRQDLLTPLTMEFNHKLKNFDSLKIELTDTLLNPYKSAMVSIDTTGKKITITNKWTRNTRLQVDYFERFCNRYHRSCLVKIRHDSFQNKKRRGLWKSLQLILKTLKNLKTRFCNLYQIMRL